MTESRQVVTVRLRDKCSLEAVRDVAEENEQLRDLLAHATEFTFRPDYGDVVAEFADYENPEVRDAIVLSWRGPAEEGSDPDRWAIKWRAHSCWSRAEQAFVYESSAGNRGDDFIADTRFGLEKAVALVPSLLRRIEEFRIPQLRETLAKWAKQ